MTTKRHALFEVKAVTEEGSDENGEFEAILSVPVLDRDNEVIDAGAFEPLPSSIPVHAFHDFDEPVGVAVPTYTDGVLTARGVFDPDAESQRIRSKVGRSIGFMSVGFMDAERETKDGIDHITRAELLEASFVSVPSNREAAILAVKSAHTKAGSRNSASDAARLQSIHDLAVENGAKCVTEDAEPKTSDTNDDDKSATAPAPAGAAADKSAAVPTAADSQSSSDRVAWARLAAMRAEAELLLA